MPQGNPPGVISQGRWYDSGTDIPPNDPNWDQLQALSLQARENPALWLGMASVYGDLSQNSRLQDRFAHWLTSLWSNGTEATLKSYIAA